MGNGNERPVRRAYRNPTEDMAIGNIMREERRKKRNEGRKCNEERKRTAGFKLCHRISVWREEDVAACSGGEDSCGKMR